MITTVCLNPAIDQSAEVDCLLPGKVNRLQSLRSQIGGKGINVAIMLNHLHTEVRCIYCTGESDAQFFAQGMEHEGLLYSAVSVPGSVRCNLKVIETSSRVVTEFNQQGAYVDAKTMKKFRNLLAAQSGGCMALCGSLPPGCGQDTYADIIRALPDRQWVVDTSGEAMRQAIQAKPYLIKPNQPELEELVGYKLPDIDAVKNAAVGLCRAGVRHVVVSLGKQGSLATDGETTVFSPAVLVEAAFTVGAGDSMLAGILYGIDRGETVFDSLRYGTAAGAACVEGGSIHSFSSSRFKALLGQTEIRQV